MGAMGLSNKGHGSGVRQDLGGALRKEPIFVDSLPNPIQMQSYGHNWKKPTLVPINSW